MNRGKYILIEGGDGSGKGTQIQLLSQYLKEKNIPFIQTREPGGTEISEILRDIVLTKRKEELTPQAELFSYLAARSQVIFHVVKPNLEKGAWVISDRGFPSTIAYQGFGLGIDWEFISAANEYALTHNEEYIYPDLVFIIDVPVELGLEKATKQGADRQESRSIDFHRNVNLGYQHYLENYSDSIRISYIEKGEITMHNQIIKNLEKRFGI